MELKKSGTKLQLHYSDDGIGFDYENSGETIQGFGLFNINSRINSIGGKLIFKSAIGHGVNVTIETNL
jgi:signal transduction histidine kinase